MRFGTVRDAPQAGACVGERICAKGAPGKGVEVVVAEGYPLRRVEHERGKKCQRHAERASGRRHPGGAAGAAASELPAVELSNVKGLTLLLVFNINNITTTGLPNNSSLTLRACS